MSWIGQALQTIDQKVIEDSWRMSCAGYRPSVFHLRSDLWKRVLSFLNDGPSMEVMDVDSQGAVRCRSVSSDVDQLACIRRDRKLFTAWRGFTFPVKKKRKAAYVEQPIVATSAPSKRRKEERQSTAMAVTATTTRRISRQSSPSEQQRHTNRGKQT